MPVVPVSPAYSLMSQDYGKVKHIAALVKPGLVYAADAGPFGGVLAAVDFGGAELVLSSGAGATALRRARWPRKPTGAVEDALRGVGPDSVAKVLFTSGSTAMPKGVINTHGMLVANQQSLAQIWPFTEDTPPVLVDWLPWNHTFGGNHNFNLILKRGGTLYIDAGRPAPPLIADHRAQPDGDRADDLLQRARGLRRAAAVPGARRRRCARASSSAWT